MTGQKLQMSEVLQELEVRQTYLTSEVQRRCRYLEDLPDCRNRHLLALEIAAGDAAARELRDLEQMIRGEDAEQGAPTRRCRPRE